MDADGSELSQQSVQNELKRKNEEGENQVEGNSVEPAVKNAKLDDIDNTASAEGSSKDKDGNPAVDLDPLAYTKSGFTSEIFKIQIHNLPRFGFSELKKRMSSLGLKPHKLKSPKPEVTYVCFRNEDDRRTAIAKLNGHTWKGKTLSAKEAAPLADPFLERLKQSKEGTSTMTCVETFTPEQSLNKLKNNVMPLWEMEYPKQLEFKNKKMIDILRKLAQHHCVRADFRKRPGWHHGALACRLLPIIASPKLTEYRNKNEFTIGYDQDGKTIRVGFRYGLYKSGTTCIGDLEGVDIVKPAAIKVTKSFEQFLRQSKWAPYLQQTESGNWYQLTVRTFESGDVMVMVDFTPRQLGKEDLERALESVREYYTQGPGNHLNIKSFYFRTNGKPPEGFPQLQLIYGDPYVYETVLGLKFRISPDAFFQVNTVATEQLYKLIAEWSEADSSSTVLDVCCGTGTIGLSMAKNVKQVIGVEMCQPAIDDARHNAQLNGITNVKYICGKVEDVMQKVLKSLDESVPSPSSSTTTTTSTTNVSSSDGTIAIVNMTTTTENTTNILDITNNVPTSLSINDKAKPATNDTTNAGISTDTTTSSDVTNSAATDVPTSMCMFINDKVKPATNDTTNAAISTDTTTSSDVTNNAATDVPTSTSMNDESKPSLPTMQTTSKTDLIAILDPPRAGVHKTVIKSIRGCEDIQRLVYVSCSPHHATDNFVDLIRPPSSKHRGKAFTLEKAVAIDLFPSTRHAELLLLFTR